MEDQWHAIWEVSVSGSGSLPSTMSRMSHGREGWRSVSASILVGVIIQRTTLEMVRGWTDVDLTESRKEAMVVDGVSEMRCSVARGMLTGVLRMSSKWHSSLGFETVAVEQDYILFTGLTFGFFGLRVIGSCISLRSCFCRIDQLILSLSLGFLENMWRICGEC